MCGRYQITTNLKQIARRFRVPEERLAEMPDMPQRYNVAPTQPVPVVRVSREGERRLELMRWGLVPSWAKDVAIGNRMINARSEEAAIKPAFRAAMKYRRCVVPADGFYEWHKLDATGKKKQPYHIHLKSRDTLAFAGLYERWQDEHGNELDSCAVLTTAANGFVSKIHDRMPVVLRDDDSVAAWLDPSVQDAKLVQPLLAPLPEGELEATPVSGYVSNPRNDGPQCIASMAGDTLFG